MIRRADRPLTGPSQSRAYRADSTVNEPEIKLGRRPGKPSDTLPTRVRREDNVLHWDDEPAPHRGQPAVTVDLNAGRSGARTFEDPHDLEALGHELIAAAGWLLGEQRRESPLVLSETELPGMWEAADFTGGQDEVRP